MFKWIKRGFVTVVVVLIFAVLHYSLPSSQVVRVTDSESRILGGTTGGGSEDAPAQVRDVSLIYATTLDGVDKVFRNEDTGFFGFPPYFKFNSENIAARAQGIAGEDGQYALLTSYGWRVEFLSMFPNVTGLKRVDRDYSHFPLFTVVFFVVVAGVAGFVVIRVRGRAARRARAREQAAAEAAAAAARADQKAAEDLAAGLNRGGGSGDDPWRS